MNAHIHYVITLHYGWPPSKLPHTCDCGNGMTVEHVPSCSKGGFPTIIKAQWTLTANLLTEVCSDVCIEPKLYTASHATTAVGATANKQDGARLDISTNGVCVCVWEGGEVWEDPLWCEGLVFNPHAPLNRNKTLSACYIYTRNISERKRGPMNNGNMKLSAPPSSPSSLQWLVVCEMRQPPFISACPHCCI